MERIEKTVFISYRRTDLPWARVIYNDLTTHGYDAFFDFQSLNSGDFSQLLLENIKFRAHFVLLLTPKALEKCENPDDWLRKEIETAIDSKRNIIPLMLDNFDFGNPSVAKYLTGKLALLKDYSGFRVHPDYVDEAMERLRERFLHIPLNAVIHPLSEHIKLVTIERQSAANRSLSPKVRSGGFQTPYELNNETTKVSNKSSWLTFTNPIRSIQTSYHLSRAKEKEAEGNLQDALKSYNDAVRINPNHYQAYLGRGILLANLLNLHGAINDFSKAIQINPSGAEALYGRGFCRQAIGNDERAINDYLEAIRAQSNYPRPYHHLGHIYSKRGEISKAFSCYQKAIALSPYDGSIRGSMVRVLLKLGKPEEAFEYEQIARSLMENETDYNKACLEAICGNLEVSFELLKSAVGKGDVILEWARQDPDFENLRNNLRFKALVGL